MRNTEEKIVAIIRVSARVKMLVTSCSYLEMSTQIRNGPHKSQDLSTA